ncbi:uncharacterized protein DEA37_0011451 [Paragonimus westermani]|uniref:C-type lectin domain-containing protein n=1 Tax=Paragonimus westermani TaxID=34504 RepID=A0A5J4NAG6_9TREM|nr:uncharacterized protein DEA37_0011451 [Paragonimus westermani]
MQPILISMKLKEMLNWGCLLLLFYNIPIALPQCPADLTVVEDNLCILLFDEPVPYCEAHNKCHAEGVKRGIRMFLVGMHASKLISKLQTTSYTLTGINRLLHDVGDFYSSWMANDPGCSPCLLENNTIIWQPGNHNRFPEQRIIVCNVAGCMPITQSVAHSDFVCEMSNYTQANRRKTTVYKTDWPVTITDPFMPDSQNTGCFETYHNSTILFCSKM